MREVAPGVIEYGNPGTPAVPPRHITHYALKARMTSAERIAIRAAAAGDTTVQDWMDLAASAQYIDLDLAEMRAGVLGLEAATLLATGRALEILDSPVLDMERP